METKRSLNNKHELYAKFGKDQSTHFTVMMQHNTYIHTNRQRLQLYIFKLVTILQQTLILNAQEIII